MLSMTRIATNYQAIWDLDNPVVQERGRGNPMGSCQVPLDPGGDLLGKVWGSWGEGSAHPWSPREGKGLAVCQYRLSSERGRELWKDVMDRR